MKFTLPKFKRFKVRWDKHVPIIIGLILVIAAGFFVTSRQTASLQSIIRSLTQEKDRNLKELEKIGGELQELKSQDPHKRNEDLQEEIAGLQATYTRAIAVHDDIADLRARNVNTITLERVFADALFKLSQKDVSGANDTIDNLISLIQEEEQEIAESFTIPESVPENNAPPGSGYSRQSVNAEGLGNYLVSIVAADISQTRVIVDTASDTDCGNDCPVLSLSEYVSRNGAYAGINGSYFCPADYASCAGKTNTFDLLVMNYKKTYFNSNNNVYSANPAVIFGESYIRFVTSVSQWGRDTSPNGVLSNFPLLVFNNQVVFGGDDDPKKGSKGGRSFVANKGNTIYIGVVHSATVAESARVLATMGMENALNLDNGGSTALWSGGYKVGPGRNLPNVILFVSK